MQIENDYDKEVYNGDIGYTDDVDPNAGEIPIPSGLRRLALKKFITPFGRTCQLELSGSGPRVPSARSA